MPDTDQLQIDLADPENIRENLPRAERLLEQKRMVYIQAKVEYENWADMFERLHILAGVPMPEQQNAENRARDRQRILRARRQRERNIEQAKHEVAPANVVREQESIRSKNIRAAIAAESSAAVPAKDRSAIPGSTGGAPKATSSPHRSVQDTVVSIVKASDGPIRPSRVAEIMREKGIAVTSTNAVNSALYAAMKSGRLIRPAQGLYASRDWTPTSAVSGQQLLDPEPGSQS